MDDLYASKDAGTQSETADETETPESVDEESESEPTALLPKSAFGGKTPKEGETVTLRVVKDYGDEVEVCPCAEEKPMKPMAMNSNEEIDAMNEEGA